MGLIALVVTGLMVAAPQAAVPGRAVVCATVDRPPTEAAAALEPLGEPGRVALLQLAASGQLADAACGVAGLAALGDVRVVPPLRAALANPAFRDDAYRFARWATFAAGGPSPELGAAFLPLVATLEDPAVWKAAGDDAVGLLGAIDHPAARQRLVAEFARPQSGATLDALIHALARHGEPSVHARMAALGAEAVASRSGNLTYEQASRIGSAAFYLLAQGPDAIAEGLQLLRQLTPGDQADIAAWAAQTWCERATRRPAERAAATNTHAALVGELDGMNILWRDLVRGSFKCGAPVA